MSGSLSPAILWFRDDLRLSDNPPLHAAAAQPVLPVYVLDDDGAGTWAAGGAQRWWLHHSLAALTDSLRQRGVELLLLRGRAERLIPELAARLGAPAVNATASVAPWARRRDAAVAEALGRQGRALLLHNPLLADPDRLRTGQGKPYSVYTPFARAVMNLGEPPPPIPAPDALRGTGRDIQGLALDELGLLPRAPNPDWARAFHDLWQPGEAGARARLEAFLEDALGDYPEGRNRPGEDGSSRLSAHLRWGEISPRQVWHAARDAGLPATATQAFLKEILWREFAQHMLWHRPEMPEQPLHASYAYFPYRRDAGTQRAWRRGITGYPLVDAGMRQLWRLGWMHNRVRMICASFFIKHLLQPWQDGAAWFWDTLVDADLASNAFNWQWVAGCGADAAPFFRVFNPILQGESFDPRGEYVRHFVPELARLPDKWLHRPWEAPAEVLRTAGLRLGEDYPLPVIDHATGRARALEALAEMRKAAA
ncbi:cryptochrome/photolyase family protein [Roseomonas marmotae]|uniref:Deoxyribodipyrimidine photo-lyase n=1 Tax=Roseomonas marmotae TaxID=2768161 RepID=A0ABS3K9W7_9PROT|nr:deoxyribodipyrimidine photo-lyase [Roseomonas marmotae]MBO1074263.1 deoxyribodipyrimidine photo-lyase [Roseomonas marmotae]QTI78017.1 deoxyribodipyrimidine photo-lyase [Roseomonas marmotae]